LQQMPSTSSQSCHPAGFPLIMCIEIVWIFKTYGNARIYGVQSERHSEFKSLL